MLQFKLQKVFQGLLVGNRYIAPIPSPTLLFHLPNNFVTPELFSFALF